MSLPKDFDCEKSCPQDVKCIKCKCRPMSLTNLWRLTTTGIVEQLYVCHLCWWTFLVRYDAMKPAQYSVVECYTPAGKGKPRLFLKGAISRLRMETQEGRK